MRPVPRLLRELASPYTAVVAVLSVLLGLPATLLLTPDQHVTVAGQDLAVGARVPTLSWSGPAQLVQIGNTHLDVPPLRIAGPLRPRITLGPVQRNAAVTAAFRDDPRSTVQHQITSAFLRWYAWAAVMLLAITIGLVALAGCLRMLLTLRRESRRRNHEPLTVAQLWQHSHTQIWAMLAGSIALTMIAWAACGGLAYRGVVDGLSRVRSLTDLVGYSYLAPTPVGAAQSGFTGAVIGDSRAARLGGPLIPDANAEDRQCARSTDSLAAEISALASVQVANLACSGATIANGLRGPQAGVPPQVGRLEQLTGLKFVVVVVGPNDLGWVDQLRYCYGVADCRDKLTAGEFTYRLADFDRSYGDLLHDLNDLSGAPQIIVMTSYDVFEPDANCADTRGPAGTPGLSAQNIALLRERNQALNEVLTAGAQKYNFTLAQPVLAPLCAEAGDSLGPDIQGLSGPAAFHPTGVGELRMASSVVRVLQTR